MAKKHIQVVGDFFRESFELKTNVVYSVAGKVFWVDSKGYVYINSLDEWNRMVQRSMRMEEDFTGTIACKKDIVWLIRSVLEQGGFLYEGEFAEE